MIQPAVRAWMILCISLCLAQETVAAEELSAGSRFAVAIENGDLEAVKSLVRGGSGPDTLIEYGDHKLTPLMKACWDGREEIATFLLDAGAKINAVDDQAQSALFSAVTRDRLELVRMLIQRGANVNLKDSREFTPLTSAVAAGNLQITEILIKSGADLSAETHGLTPLMFAASTGNSDMIRLLVALGAQVNQGSRGGDPGSTALFNAIYSGKTEVVQTLIDLKADVNAKSRSGDTPMKIAIHGDQAGMIDLLAKAGAKGAPKTMPAPSAKPAAKVEMEPLPAEAPPGMNTGNSEAARKALAERGINLQKLEEELQEAVDMGDVELAQQLIDAGANAGWIGEYGESLLMRAAGIGNMAIVQLLIRSGADVNLPNEFHVTPLANAAERGNADVVSLLLKAGANVNARNTYGGTALQVAVLRGYIDIVKILIAAGADVARDRKELIDLAKQENHPDIEKLLREAPARPR